MIQIGVGRRTRLIEHREELIDKKAALLLLLLRHRAISEDQLPDLCLEGVIERMVALSRLDKKKSAQSLGKRLPLHRESFDLKRPKHDLTN